MRILSIAIVALLTLAGAVQAQVAAPMLNPALTPGSTNPAVLPWAGPSRVSVSVLDLEVEGTAGGGFPITGSADGFAAQVRLVGENFAFQAEMLSLTIDATVGGTPGTFEQDATAISAAYQGGEVFSIGVGVESEEETDASGGVSSTVESSLPVLGATLRLGEIYFLGAAVGTETVKDAGGEEDRSVIRIGAAVHSRDNDGGFHLEVFIENADSATGTLIDPVTKDETVGLTAEFVFGGGWLIGLGVQSTDSTDAAGAAASEEKERIISVGWAPGEGLAVVLSLLDNEDTDAAGDTLKISGTILSVAWMF